MKPLHEYQVKILRLWRSKTEQGNTPESDQLLSELLRSISAIAGAIGFTG
jgi:hypothetical protein